MSAVARVKLEAVVEDGDGITTHYKSEKNWGTAALIGGGVREVVALTGSAFTALSPPTGAKAVVLSLPTSAESLTLKGASGDSTGIALSPSSGFVGIDALIPLSSASIGILNGDSTTVNITCLWL